MASTPLILTLTVLTATILILLLLWVFIRYTKDRRTRAHSRSHSADPHLHLAQHAAYAPDDAESNVHLHCQYQPQGALQAAGGGVELKTVTSGEDGERAEAWLKRGASRDDVRTVGGEGGEGRGGSRC
ncbi:uncharacterized protein M421DRAFT_1716 [Didymella exigua CBS 183.55]|uniref:Uncharacterized protein n=1 Tax=Didymella exigua CBS 183.55 TaxID=1150837 RepID=A0A6A5S0M6_9PLEO|nr:uncharacterized protein M421DRAFT_1716 [Didymella exigua CBS 183.55]KAF1932036.1 hypothetical protein M421DRAFT_1716 [Didymella exigua CBS 183.55]